MSERITASEVEDILYSLLSDKYDELSEALAAVSDNGEPEDASILYRRSGEGLFLRMRGGQCFRIFAKPAIKVGRSE